MHEGLMILELMKNIKNQYLRANLENKSKILKILLSNCELKGVNTSFYWNKPFDILFELGKSEKRGSSQANYRTVMEYLKHISEIAVSLKELIGGERQTEALRTGF